MSTRMTRSFLMCITVLSVGACTTTGVPNASNTSTPTETAPTPIVDKSVTAESPSQTSAESKIEMIDVPPIELSEATIVDSTANERVCRRERRTGSHRAVRVCRTRAEIERIKQESKETFDDLLREQAISDMPDPTGRH